MKTFVEWVKRLKMLELKPVIVSLARQGDEKFVCLICGAGFAIEKHLKNHALSNHEGKPFRCLLCLLKINNFELSQ